MFVFLTPALYSKVPVSDEPNLWCTVEEDRCEKVGVLEMLD